MKILYFIAKYLLVVPFCKICFWLTIKGKKNIPKKGPYIIACNHQSVLDIVFLIYMCRRQVHFIAKKEIFKKAKAEATTMQDSIDSSNVNLTSDISTVKESVGIPISSIKEIKPRKKGDINIERIELNLREVPLDQTLTFLYGLENKGRYVFVDSITIKKRFNKQNYDVSLVVAAMKKESANGE